MKEPIKWIRLTAASLLALMIFTCIAPEFKKIFGEHVVPQKQVTLRVIGAGEEGGTEVWIASIPQCELSGVPFDSANTIMGECEFRTAREYGYSYDFLISFGENIGTELNINYTPLTDSYLYFYAWSKCGEVEVTSEEGTLQLSLYKSSPDMVKFSLTNNKFYLVLYFAIQIVLIAILTVLLYCFLRKISFRPLDTQKAQNKRDVSLDLIRAVAALMVVFIHSFMAAGYYERPLGLDLHSIGLTGIRWLCGCCNALFLLLSGYLLRKRESVKKAIVALLPLLVTYFAVTTVRIVVLNYVIWKQTLSMNDIVEYLVLIGFSWYLKMYIGIALITPFLNISWNKLSVEKKLLTIVVLTILCCGGGVSKQFIPSFWMELWPFLYYFCGAFMAEYRSQIKTSLLAFLLMMVIGLVSLYSVTCTSNGVFNWALFGGGGNGEHQALPLVVSSILLFSLLRRLEISNRILSGILKNISENAFCIYLFSVEITDNLVYTILRNHGVSGGFIRQQLIPVICSFCLAWLLSAILNIPLKRFERWIKCSLNRGVEAM